MVADYTVWIWDQQPKWSNNREAQSTQYYRIFITASSKPLITSGFGPSAVKVIGDKNGHNMLSPLVRVTNRQLWGFKKSHNPVKK